VIPAPWAGCGEIGKTNFIENGENLVLAVFYLFYKLLVFWDLRGSNSKMDG
jgi:hypothetical protein